MIENSLSTFPQTLTTQFLEKHHHWVSFIGMQTGAHREGFLEILLKITLSIHLHCLFVL